MIPHQVWFVALSIYLAVCIGVLTVNKHFTKDVGTVNEHQIQQAVIYCSAGKQGVDTQSHVSLDYLEVNTKGETFVMCENGANALLKNPKNLPDVPSNVKGD